MFNNFLYISIHILNWKVNYLKYIGVHLSFKWMMESHQFSFKQVLKKIKKKKKNILFNFFKKKKKKKKKKNFKKKSYSIY